MRRLVSVAVVLLWTVVLTAAWGEAQVNISYGPTYCQIGEECTLTVKVNTSEPLGRLAVVLQYNNALIQVTGLSSGGYMPVEDRLRFFNDICTATNLCNAPGPCGQIEYLGLDSGDAAPEYGHLFTVTYQVTATTSLLWGPCDAWCNTYYCVSLTPYARTYDGSVNYSMSYSAGTIDAQVDPVIDSDGDGLSDLLESSMGTDPLDADTDNDGLQDGNKGTEDANADGVVDPGETDPKDVDSDDDGIFDGTERGLTTPETTDTDVGAGYFVADADPATTTDPTDADSDDDGVLDGLEDLNRNGSFDPGLGESDPEDAMSQPPEAPTVASARVLLLGDDGAEDQVRAALEAAGHQVVVVPFYGDWDGVDPAIWDFDVVVLLDGNYYGDELTSAASSALASFVAKGCGFVATEWTAYDVCTEDKTGAVADLMPVTSAPDCSYTSDVAWLVTGTHALTSAVPTSWTDSADLSIVASHPGTIVLVKSTIGTPLLAFSEQAGGTVVHLNHDMDDDVATINANALQLLANAVSFAAVGCPFFWDSFETGNCEAWSNAVGLTP